MEIKKKHRIMLYSALILGTILVNNSYQAKAEELTKTTSTSQIRDTQTNNVKLPRLKVPLSKRLAPQPHNKICLTPQLQPQLQQPLLAQ